MNALRRPPRSCLPWRFQQLEARVAPAVLTRGDRCFTDSEILVKLTNDDPLFALTGRVVAARLGEMIDIPGSRLLYRRANEHSGLVFAKLQPGSDPDAAVTALQGQPGVEFAEVNHVVFDAAAGFPQDAPPNDPSYSKQWHLTKMKVDEAWKITTGTANIVVAVLDDGLPTTYEHEDLKTNRWKHPTEIAGDKIDQDFNGFVDDVNGWDFIDDDRNPDPAGADTHGTQVAGVIAATTNNGKGVNSNGGVAGVAGGNATSGGARVMSVRIALGGSLTVANLANGLGYAADNGAKIINLSYNVDAFASDKTFTDALNHAYVDKKALIFISAGNNNTGTADRGKLTQALFVANVDQNDKRFDDTKIGSNYGTWVDVSAPGTAIVTTLAVDHSTNPINYTYQTVTSTTTFNTGTSFAAPNAAGVAALIWSKFPTYSRDQVGAKLLGTADNIDAVNPQQIGLLGTGRVNAYRALTETLPAPRFGTITGLPDEDGITSSVKMISITAPLRFDSASVKASNFELRSDGPDNVFGTSDDATIALTVDPYQMGSNEIKLTATTTPSSDRYRFTAKSGALGLRDPFGAALDGNGNGTGGDAFVRNFQFANVSKVGGELRLNQYTNSNQFSPAIASRNDGSSVVVWNSWGQDGSGIGVFGRLIDRHGQPLGDEFQVNQYTTSDQRSCAVAVDDAGNFVVSWQGIGDETGLMHIYARKFSAVGIPLTQDLAVSSSAVTQQEAPSVAVEGDGDFVIAWYSTGQADGADVYFQRFFADGFKHGVEMRANDEITGQQSVPDVAVNDDGSFVIVWHDSNGDGNGDGIRGRRFDDTGSKVGSEIPVNTMHTLGNQNLASVALDGAGNFVVSWTSQTGDGSGSAIVAKTFTMSGLSSGDEFIVNTTSAGNQNATRQSALSVAPTGDFVVTWYAQTAGDDYEVFAQQFDVNGGKIGAERSVNTFQTEYQGDSAVALHSNGAFVVVWNSTSKSAPASSQDGSGYGCYYQCYRHATTVASLRPANDVNLIDAGERMIQPLTTAGLTIKFSGAVNVSSPTFAASATNLANYKLTVDGKDVVLTGAISTTTDPNDNTSTIITLPVPSQIASGHLVLTVKDTILDVPGGNKLDGEDNAAFGGDFVRAWDVVSIGRVGPVFQVNSYTTKHQYYPSVAVDADGDAVMVWVSTFQDGTALGIFGQRFDSVGAAVGGEFQVETYTTGRQHHPSVAVDANGDAIVVWDSEGQDGNSYGISGQRFDSVGAAVGGEFQVNTYTTSEQNNPAIAVNADGAAVVVWCSNGQDGNNYGIYGQRFNAAGTKVGGEFQINTYTTSGQLNPSVAMDADGDVFVVWRSYGQDGSNYGIYGQRFDSAGAKAGGEFQVNTYTTNAQISPWVAVDAAGNGVVVWSSDGQNGSSYGVYGQRFNAAGTKVGSEFQVNTYTTLVQHSPSVAMDADGDVVVVWEREGQGQDNDGLGILGQRFNAAGTKVGSEFQVGTNIRQLFGCSVSVDADGDAFVMWASSPLTDNFNIHAQRFGANSAPTTAGFSPAAVLEDSGATTINLGLGFTDLEDGAANLSYSVTSNPNPSLIAASVAGSTLTVTPAANANGSTTITIRATDSAGLFVEAPIVINVTPVNDAPSFVKGPDITVPVNYGLQSYPGWATSISAGPADESAQTVAFNILSNTRPDLFTTLQILPDGTLKYDPTDELFGAAILQVRAKDTAGVANGGVDFALQTVVITVAPDYVFGPVRGQATVNSTVAGVQSASSVACDADGNAVVVWTSAEQDGDLGGIYAQRYSSQGKTADSEFLVNTTVAGNQAEPAVARARDGSFVVVWAGNGPGDNAGIFARRFAADGNDPSTGPTGEFLVNSNYTTGSQTNPVVTMDLAGNFVVAWSGEGLCDFAGIFAQRYNFNGAAQGLNFRVNDDTHGTQNAPSIGADAVGNFDVVWQTNAHEAGTLGIDYRQFTADGTPRIGHYWNPQQHLTANYDAAANDHFGSSVALSANGNLAIVGTPHYDGSPNIDTGSTSVFVRGYTEWYLQSHQRPGQPNVYFGCSVSVSANGTTWVAGANGQNVDTTSDQGSAFVSMQFGIYGILFATGGAAGDKFGTSVSISADGNTVVVGAPNDDVGAESDQGSAYVFTRSGDAWTQQAQLNATGGAAGDNFGQSLSISADGNTVVVGALNDDVGANGDQGSVYVYTRSGTVWTQQAQLNATGGVAGDNLGQSVSMSADGNTVVVGALNDDVGANGNRGSAYVFTRSDNVWTQQQQLTDSGGAANDNFGFAVAISGDGATVLVGANRDDVVGNIDQGSATFFTRSGSVWTQQQQLIDSGGAANDQLGSSVAFSGNTAIIGAIGKDVGANQDQGAVIAFAIGIGDSFANTMTTGDQTKPSIAVDADGDFVITWESPDASGTGIYARRFAADGQPREVGDVPINVTTTNNQTNPRASIDADGDYAITWTGFGTNDATGIFARRFFADGTPIDAKGQLVNSITTGTQSSPAIAMDHDGEFVVAWAGETGSLDSKLAYTKVDDDGIALQRFGFPLPPTATKAIEPYTGPEDSGPTTYNLFDYFSSATGKSEAMTYSVYSVSNLAIFASYPSFNSSTGALTLNYAPNTFGESDVTVRVADTTEVPTLATFHVSIYSVNDPPILASIPAQSSNEGSAITFTAAGADPLDAPADTLSYSLIGAPAGAAIDPFTGKFTWVPPDGPSTVTFTVRVTDDGKTNNVADPKFAEQSVTVAVNNIAPSATGLSGPGSVQAGYSAAFTLNGVSDAPGDVAAGLKYSFDWTTDGIYDLVDQATATANHTYALAGSYTVRAKVADKDGGAAEYTTSVVITPHVESAQVNDGSNQRSRVTSLTVTFDELVNLPNPPSNAFRLLGPSGVLVPNVDTSESTATKTVAKLTFSGAGSTFSSLNDGKYTLTVVASTVTAGGQPMSADYSLAFHRLFGDGDGSGTVNQADFFAFRNFFNGPSVAFDYEGDGYVTQAEFIQFRNRFNLTV